MGQSLRIDSRVVFSKEWLKTCNCMHPKRVGSVVALRGVFVYVLWDGLKTVARYHELFVEPVDPRLDLTAALEKLLGPL